MGPFRFRTYSYFLSIFVCTTLTTCKTASPHKQKFEVTKKIATDKLGSDVEWVPNSTGEFFLVIQKPNSSSTTNILKLIIVARNGEVLAEQSFIPGYAKWITKSSVEVLSSPGTLKESETLANYIKIIEITSHTKKP